MRVLDKKLNHLIRILKSCDSVLVAFSGGVDSTLLLKVAHDVLGQKALAVTVSSEINPPGEVEEAESLAHLIGAKHIVVKTQGLKSPAFAGNPPDRCYHCKKEIYTILQGLVWQWGLKFIVDGVNVDDDDDYRPGIRAGMEMGVITPLKKAGLTKKEIRTLSREYGLPSASKP